MRITPLDARKQEFNKTMRGYDCAEVEAFLNTLADEYEAVLVDNKQIRERVMEQDEKLTEYQSMERNLRDTLMTAERVMKETKNNASREGDLLIKDAEMKARGILEECRMRTEELRREIVALRKEKETYLARFKSLAEAQIQFVETHKNDFEDLDRRLVDIVDSVVAGAAKAETRPSPQAVAPKVNTTTAPEPVPGIPAMPHTIAPTTEPAQGPDPFASTQEPTARAAASPASANGDQDIWRDYNPGSAKNDEAPEENAGEDNGIADFVTETFAETEAQPETSQDTPETRPRREGVDAPTPEIDLGEEQPVTSGDKPQENVEEGKDEAWSAKEEEKTPASIW